MNTYKNHIQLYTLVSGIGSAYFFTQLPTQIQLFFIIPGMMSILYTLPLFSKKRRLRDVHYIKIFVISVVWSITTAILPAHLLHKSIGVIALIGFERFLFFLSITIPFDIRDKRIDEQSDVKTLVHLLGIENSVRLSIGLLIAALFIDFILFRAELISLQSVIAFAITYIITALSIVLVSKRSSDYYFTGLLDGTMIILAIVIWISHSF